MALEGTQLGRYSLRRLLGSGGMGEVYLADDGTLNRQVAIKVIRADTSPYPNADTVQEATKLFQREPGLSPCWIIRISCHYTTTVKSTRTLRAHLSGYAIPA